MRIHWQISNADVAKVRELIDQQKKEPLVRERLRANCAKFKRHVRRRRFWQQMVSMRLTTLARVTRNSPVGRLAKARPFPLSYSAVSHTDRLRPFILRTLRNWGGIRFSNLIADQLAENFRLLEEGGWVRTLKECNRLTRRVSRAVELEVAGYIQETFEGFGPKQSRNLLQALGLTRYEIPIDSRVTKWLNEFGFPVHLSAPALNDIHYYQFVSDGIQALCAQCHIYPCILDAAIFASYGNAPAEQD
jgi:hypothetical protein